MIGEESELSENAVTRDLQKNPHILMKLAENALTVAENLRDNYFKNTAKFISALRKAIRAGQKGQRTEPVLVVTNVAGAAWSNFQGETVTFVDGGVGSVQISSQVPILLRVGSYCVKTGERRISSREQFGYYPVILGDLEGGSKERKDFVDIVRITAELLGGLSALERLPDLRVLMFHGPLVYLVGSYAGHTPFTEKDVDLFLTNYAATKDSGKELKDAFLQEAYVDIYPKMKVDYEKWVKLRLFEPLAWMSFLYRRLIHIAKSRNPIPIIAGVVERGSLREFSERLLLDRVFRGLRQKGNGTYFNQMFGRRDLNSPKALLDKLGYNDGLLLAMILQVGQCSEPWEISKYDGLRNGLVMLPGESEKIGVDFSPLQAPSSGFPGVQGSYVKVSETTEPIRVEVFPDLGSNQMQEAITRVYLYSKLLPGYGFPVGLDIVDKFAKVPSWLTSAYGKLIRFQLGVSLQRGEISDSEMRRILVQAIYMTHRDWLFRPQG
jgi:hypothetical protein